MFHCLQVKSSLLNFLHSLVQVMDVSDLMNSADSRLAISRIINWTTEPKSVDVRKVNVCCIMDTLIYDSCLDPPRPLCLLVCVSICSPICPSTG